MLSTPHACLVRFYRVFYIGGTLPRPFKRRYARCHFGRTTYSTRVTCCTGCTSLLDADCCVRSDGVVPILNFPSSGGAGALPELGRRDGCAERRPVVRREQQHVAQQHRRVTKLDSDHDGGRVDGQPGHLQPPRGVELPGLFVLANPHPSPAHLPFPSLSRSPLSPLPPPPSPFHQSIPGLFVLPTSFWTIPDYFSNIDCIPRRGGFPSRSLGGFGWARPCDMIYLVPTRIGC